MSLLGSGKKVDLKLTLYITINPEQPNMFYIKPGSISYATNRQIRLFVIIRLIVKMELFKSKSWIWFRGKDNIVFKSESVSHSADKKINAMQK